MFVGMGGSKHHFLQYMDKQNFSSTNVQFRLGIHVQATDE